MSDRETNCYHCSDLIDDLELHLLAHEKAGRFTERERQMLRRALAFVRHCIGEDIRDLAPIVPPWVRDP